MPNNDPKREFAVAVVRRLQEAGFRALWAGGCVRDFLIGRVPQDYDVATDAHPPAVQELFGRQRTLAVGASFGVIIVLGPKAAGNIEVATFRTEGPYRDGRRPDHVVFSTPQEDAQRRDFTINGMFYDPVAEKVLDYVGGEQDLGSRIVRAIGNPRDRMTEDKLRLLRAVRFTSTIDFELDPATAEAVRAMAREIHVVSAERIAQELRKMLIDPHRRRAIELCRELELLREILPELAPILDPSGDVAWQRTLLRLDWIDAPTFEVAAAAFLLGLPDAAASARAVGKRLKLSNQERDSIEWLLAHVADVFASRTKSPAQLKRLLVHRSASELIALARADALAGDEDLSAVTHCDEFLQSTPLADLDPSPLLTGNDLIAMDLKPGSEFRRILDAVRDAQLDGEITTKDEALALVRRLLEGK